MRSFLFAAILCAAASPAFADSWSSPAALGGAVSHLGAAAIGDEIYLAGGAGLAGPRPDFDSFNAKEETFKPLTSLPVGLQQFGMAALGSTIYVFGGLAGEDGDESAKVWAFDTSRNEWTERRPMPQKRYGLVAVEAGTNIYIFGGKGGSEVLIYDPVADTWRKGPAMPASRSGLAAASDGTTIYLVGGQGDGTTPSARLDVFDTATESFTQGPDMPQPRAALTAGFVGGKLHVVGGVSLENMTTYDRHDVFDPKAGAWSRGKPMPTARHSLASAVAGGKWYVFGGGVGAGFFSVFTASDAVEVYAP